MEERTTHELMASYADLAAEERRRRREKADVLDSVSERLTDSVADGLIESAPSRERVLARTADLGVAEDDARDRLARLADLDVVDLADGQVYPDTNFAKF